MVRIYTRTGDDGTTSLGTGERVEKSSLRIGSYGTVDELNSTLGVARSIGLTQEGEAVVAKVQHELFHLGCELSMGAADDASNDAPNDAPNDAIDGPHVEARHVESIESAIDSLSDRLPALSNFILPAGAASASQLHVARCVCRRAERELTALRASEPVRDLALRYLNRLSDLLFVLARFENSAAGVADDVWDSSA